MLMYTRCPQQLVGPAAWFRRVFAARKARLVAALLLVLCASCSELWHPYIENFDLSCSESSTPCPRAQDMLPPPAPADLSGPGCSSAASGTVQIFKQQVGTSFFRGIWGADAANVWAVGGEGTIAKWNGSAWAMQNSTTQKSLFAVWGSSADFLVAGGESGTVLTSTDRSHWTTHNLFIVDTIYGIWGSGPTSIWTGGDTTILGNKGFIVHWDGSNFLKPYFFGGGVTSLWGKGKDTDIWATGGGGSIQKWDGSNWSAQQSNTPSGLPGVWGIDANQIWAVGDSGTILKWDGTTWTAQASNIGSTALFAVWGMDACNIWAVGARGAIVRWNGVRWSPQPSGTTLELGSVWGSDARDLWVGGAEGTLLHVVPQ